uniref:SET domain-containing protein n=1 Tax=Magallana gigas TaxID=29159 RepID=A0A8W8MHM7_MAGGI
MNKEAVNPVKAKRIRSDEDAKFWCQAGLDKDGFEKRFINNTIGFGVFTTAFFQKGAFLLEYVGNRISEKEAEIRERKRRKKKHSYMFHFKWNGKHVQHFHKTKMEMKTTEVTDDDDDDPFDLKKPRFSEKKEQCQSKAKVSCMLEMIDLVMMMT